MEIDKAKVDAAIQSFREVNAQLQALELARLKNNRLVCSLNTNEFLEYAYKTSGGE
jgi:hypothetical protein